MRYTVDPDGRMTIQTPSPVTKSAAIDLFQSALAANGAAIINANGMVRIVPIDLAPFQPRNVSPSLTQAPCGSSRLDV